MTGRLLAVLSTLERCGFMKCVCGDVSAAGDGPRPRTNNQASLMRRRPWDGHSAQVSFRQRYNELNLRLHSPAQKVGLCCCSKYKKFVERVGLWQNVWSFIRCCRFSPAPALIEKMNWVTWSTGKLAESILVAAQPIWNRNNKQPLLQAVH